MRWRTRGISLAGAMALGSAFAGCVLKANGFSSGVPPDGGGVPLGDAGPVATSDAAGSSGPQPADAGDDAGSDGAPPPDPEKPNLLLNGDFELGCAGWDTEFAFLSESTDAHGGSRSCKFCMDTNYIARIQRAADAAVKKGESYVGEIWVKAVGDPATLRSKGLNGSQMFLFTSTQGFPTPGPPVTADWQRATALVTASADANTIGLDFALTQDGNPASVGDVICILVDDAAIHKL